MSDGPRFADSVADRGVRVQPRQVGAVRLCRKLDGPLAVSEGGGSGMG